MDSEQKMERLGALYDEWDECTRCGLCDPPNRRRHNVVFGEGNPNAYVMIVGEAPDNQDDINGRPFNGRPGEIIDMFLESLNSDREEVFITHTVACRPTKPEDPKRNRPPSKAEIAECSERLSKIIDIIDPYVVLLLGDTAFKALSPKKGTLSSVIKDRNIPDVRVSTPGVFMPVTRSAFATWHPNYLVANWTMAADGPVRQSIDTWEKAFRVADMFAQLYRGVTPPSRRNNGP